MIYHKFSHGAAFYTLNGENVNIMLEYILIYCSISVFQIGRVNGDNSGNLVVLNIFT